MLHAWLVAMALLLAPVDLDRGSAPDPGSVARGGPFASAFARANSGALRRDLARASRLIAPRSGGGPLRSLAGALCAPPLCGSPRVPHSRAEPHSGPMLNLEVRVFDGDREVTAHTRVTIYTAGDRETPVAQTRAGGPPAESLMRVPAGIYDAQAVRHWDGRVVAIRWAERLVIMPYPDEAGHHLQVINFASAYGALQIRTEWPVAPDDKFALLRSAGLGEYTPAEPSRHGYVLFVVPAGQYDLQVTRGSRVTWHHGIEVPLDRTRFWVPR